MQKKNPPRTALVAPRSGRQWRRHKTGCAPARSHHQGCEPPLVATTRRHRHGSCSAALRSRVSFHIGERRLCTLRGTQKQQRNDVPVLHMCCHTNVLIPERFRNLEMWKPGRHLTVTSQERAFGDCPQTARRLYVRCSTKRTHPLSSGCAWYFVSMGVIRHRRRKVTITRA